jgi:hypothetical protein
LLSCALLLGVVCLAPSCSDKDRRMSEGETLAYKRQLVLSHEGEISTTQAEELLYHPARTQGQIDTYFEKLLSDFAARKKAEEAIWLQAHKASSLRSSTPGSEESP